MSKQPLQVGPHKSTPYPHQRNNFTWCLNTLLSKHYLGLLMEQRTGKTWMCINLAAELYRRGLINGFLVIAPNGVHTTWVEDQIPTHLHDDTEPTVFKWRSGSMGSKVAQQRFADFVACKGLAIFVINIDALLIKEVRQTYLPRFMAKRAVYSVIDEALDIGNRESARADVAMKIGLRSKYRSILEGTPVAAGPLGLFSQTEFLQPGALGFTSFYAFRNRYAVFEQVRTGPDTERKVVVGFKHLDELQERLGKFCFRITRAECTDMPPKVHDKHYFELDKEQRRIYNGLRDEYIAELNNGQVVTADMVLTRYLRLQQVSSGFLNPGSTSETCPACAGEDPDCTTCEGYGLVVVQGEVIKVGDSNPRLDAFVERFKKMSGQGVVWGRFKQDIDQIGAWCDANGVQWARYDGSVKDKDKTAARRAFEQHKVQLIVGNSKAGGRGLDLSMGNFMFYYSHEWSLRARLQSEDRLQNLKKKDPSLYIDLVCANTVDSKIVKALRDGKNLSDLVTGDKPEDWL